MIHVTRLNHRALVLNADLIESIEVTPDTVITLTTGQKLVVLETPDAVIGRVVQFRHAIHSGELLDSQVAGRPSGEPGVEPDHDGNS